MDELVIGGRQYISSKRASEITGYAKDYIGQLCRGKRIEGKLVGRNWYVEPRSLLHLSQKKNMDSTPSAETSLVREIRNPHLIEESSFVVEPENVSFEADTAPLVPPLSENHSNPPEDETTHVFLNKHAYAEEGDLLASGSQSGLEETRTPSENPDEREATTGKESGILPIRRVGMPSKPSHYAVDLRTAEFDRELREKSAQKRARQAEVSTLTEPVTAQARKRAFVKGSGGLFSLGQIQLVPLTALAFSVASIAILIGSVINRVHVYPTSEQTYSVSSFSELSAAAATSIKNLGQTR